MSAHSIIIIAILVDIQSISSQDEEYTSWKWDTSKTKLWNEDTQRKHGNNTLKAKTLNCMLR